MVFPRTLRVLLSLFLTGLAATGAPAQEVAPGYVHQQWTARDGLPGDGLTDVLQVTMVRPSSCARANTASSGIPADRLAWASSLAATTSN